MKIMNRITGTFNKVGFVMKKNSPEILIAVGVIGTVASAVMACRATTKVNEIMDKTKEQLDAIHECSENPEMADEYSADDVKKDTAIVYVQMGVKFVKLYAPAVALGVLSLSSILASNGILRKRYVAMASAYAAVDHSYKEYRGRVIERFGEEIDRELKYGTKAVEIKKKVTDENGEEKTVTETVNVTDSDSSSGYERFFERGNLYWEEDADYNMMFLRARQAMFNDKLKVDGHVFLNDVYKELDLPVSKAGQIVGWRYDPDNPQIDNYIDFGIHEIYRKSSDSENGYEQAVLLDFNVDGDIWKMMR